MVEVDAGNEMFAMLDHNGLQTWWVTSVPEVYEDHVSNLRMQDKLRNAGYDRSETVPLQSSWKVQYNIVDHPT